MTDRVGVGCFNYAPTRVAPFSITQQEFQIDLSQFLNAVSSISEVRIQAGGNSVDPIEIDEPLEPISRGPNYFPGFDLTVQFQVHIPRRVQVDLLSDDDFAREIVSEDFIVHNIDSYYIPVTYIYPVGVDERSPSLFVRLVREFLRAEFAKIPSPKLSFECLGPSPFHMDIYLVASDTVEDIYNLKVEPSIGYDHCELTHHSRISEQEALSFLVVSTAEQFGLSYYAQCTDVGSTIAWEKVFRSVDVLVQSRRERGFRRRLRGWRNQGLALEMCYLDIAAWEMNHLQSWAVIEETLRSLARSGDDQGLNEVIESRIANRFDAPLPQTLRILDVLNSSNGIKSLNAAVLASAVIGAVFGASISGLFNLFS